MPPGAAEGDADGLAEAPVDALEDGAGLADGDADGAGLVLALAAGEPEAPAEPDGDAVGRASVGTGVACGAWGWSPMGTTVRISMNPEPVESAVASRPCSAKTASTWSGVTDASSNLISHLVPPV